jgi:transposase-like protein
VSWFYAIYLFVTTRHGVSGKELQRQLGVTYKTAYRMGMQIRKLIASTENYDKLGGHIEADETYVGGAKSGGKRGRGAPGKTIVMGMVQRGGDVRAVVVPNVKMSTIRAVMVENVERGSIVSTDELMSYGLTRRDGFIHGTIRHSDNQWKRYDPRRHATYSTNTIEGFWKLFKASVRSTHIHVSSKHMQAYLSEFSFRSNHRSMVNGMFDLLIAAI